MERIPVEPFPPGEYIQEAMDARGWTQDDLAEVLGRNRHTVLRLLNGKTAVTPDTAHALAQAFGTSAELWMNLQTAYELSLAALENRDIEKRAAIYARTPVRDLKKRGWIPDVSDTDQLQDAVCKFLRIASLSDPPSVRVAARKSTCYESSTPEQEAWFCRARMLAEAAPARQYRRSSFEDGLDELRKLMAYAEDVRRVPRVLSEMGVRFVIVEPLPKTKVDGVAFRVGDNPAVAMSLRYDRIDNFWFTLMHELSHVLHEDESPIDLDAAGSQGEPELPAIEKRANSDACRFLVPPDKLESFIARKKRVYSKVSLSQFAQLRGVHPGIVVGLLHGRGELDWKYLRGFLVKVRSEIVESALTDGWGRVTQI